MEIGSDRAFKMQEPSHKRSCGQTREQISGILLVEREIAAASRNWPSAVKAIHSGIRLAKGQPVTQSGSGHGYNAGPVLERLPHQRTSKSQEIGDPLDRRTFGGTLPRQFMPGEFGFQCRLGGGIYAHFETLNFL